MKRLFLLAVTLGLLSSPLPAATNELDEQHLIGVLQSSASLHDKDAACARLKKIGTAQSVPALASLLADDQLSHSARYALESMQAPEAGRALVAALDKTSGMTRVGIIYSVGVRREPKAVSALAKILKTGASAGSAQSSAAETIAAATALGEIGDSDALKTLQAQLGKTTGALHTAVVDGTLRNAEHLLADGNRSKAIKACESLLKTEKTDGIRIAAYRAIILSPAPDALTRLAAALTGNDGVLQSAALSCVFYVKDPQATKVFTDLLPKVSPDVQAGLVFGLSQRGDTAAAPAIAALAKSSSPFVRLNVLRALGNLGDENQIMVLAQAAASSSALEQATARDALLNLRHGNITSALLKQLSSAAPNVQTELARALGDRRDTAAIPGLLDLAAHSTGSVHRAACQALAFLAADKDLPALVQLVADSKDEANQAHAVEGLQVACQRILARQGKVDLSPVTKSLSSGSPELRVALLPVCSTLATPETRAALRAAVADASAPIHMAAVRALCDSSDAELFDDIVKIASNPAEEQSRNLAIAACVRLTTQEEAGKLSNAQKLAAFNAILATSPKPEQKRQLLAGVAEVPEAEALKIANDLLAESEVSTEASRAVIRIAPTLGASQLNNCTGALKSVINSTNDPQLRKDAEAALKQIQLSASYITDWQYAGPYFETGRNYWELFMMPFGPETAAANDVKWRALPGGADAKRPGVMDLLKVMPGEQRVAYIRTWVYSEQEQPVRLEFGTDDGVKLWVDGKLIHQNNASRGLQPASDKSDFALNAGWTPIMMKITQNTLGWEFCAHFLKRDGTLLTGLKYDANHDAQKHTSAK